jgi:hypothetical protein
MDICVERTYDGVCTVSAPNLVVSGLSEEAADALVLALRKFSANNIADSSLDTKRRQRKRDATSSNPARQEPDQDLST